MYLSQYARERLVADRARELEGQAERSRLAAGSRDPRLRSIGARDRLVVSSCRALRLDDVGAGRGRVSGVLVAPLVTLERSCTVRLARIAPACC